MGYRFPSGGLCILASLALLARPAAAQYNYYNATNITAELLPYYALPSSSSTCPSTTEILLYLDAYLVFSCIASLILGASSIRALISHTHFFSFFSDSTAEGHHAQRLRWISTAGSLFIQFGATVVTADVLTASNGANTMVSVPLSRMFLLWLSRPLATGLVTWLSIADRAAYRDNAREVAVVDGLYSAANVYLFVSVARVTNVLHPVDVPAPARLARAGSAVWLLAFVLSLAALVWYTLESCRRRSKSTNNDNRRGGSFSSSLLPLLPWIWAALDWLRFLGCWLLWAGLLFNAETAFCPSHRALVGVTLIWLFVPFLDGLWRAFASHTRDGSGGGGSTGGRGTAEAEVLIEMEM